MTSSTRSLPGTYSRDSDYLTSVFSDFGIQLNREGKVVQMPTLVHSTTLHRPGSATEKDKSLTHKRPKLDSLEDNDKESDMISNKMKVLSSPAGQPLGKPKIYMLPPMDNPEDEKRRKNAIIARRNRVVKKLENMDLQKKAQKLEEANGALYNTIQQMDQELKECREERRRVLSMITELQNDKHSLHMLLHAQQEKLAFIREHLHLINGTTDEDNPTRRLLTALLERMDTASTAPSVPPASLPTLAPRASSPSQQSVPLSPHTVSPSYITFPSHTISPHLNTLPSSGTMPALSPNPKSAL